MIRNTSDTRTPTFVDDDLMPFGKHINKRLEEIPASYLLWLWENKCRNKELDNYIWNNLQHLLDECPDHVLGRKS